MNMDKPYSNQEIPSTEFNWQESVKLACDNEQIAKEMLDMLVVKLDQFHADISNAYSNKDFQTLQQQVHKLHGGLCYISTPKLRYLSYHLETACKTDNQAQIDEIMQQYPDCILSLHTILSGL